MLLYEKQGRHSLSLKFAEVRAEGECAPVAACHTAPLCRQPPAHWRQCCIGTLEQPTICVWNVTMREPVGSPPS